MALPCPSCGTNFPQADLELRGNTVMCRNCHSLWHARALFNRAKEWEAPESGKVIKRKNDYEAYKFSNFENPISTFLQVSFYILIVALVVYDFTNPRSGRISLISLQYIAIGFLILVCIAFIACTSHTLIKFGKGKGEIGTGWLFFRKKKTFSYDSASEFHIRTSHIPTIGKHFFCIQIHDQGRITEIGHFMHAKARLFVEHQLARSQWLQGPYTPVAQKQHSCINCGAPLSPGLFDLKDGLAPCEFCHSQILLWHLATTQDDHLEEPLPDGLIRVEGTPGQHIFFYKRSNKLGHLLFSPGLFALIIGILYCSGYDLWHLNDLSMIPLAIILIILGLVFTGIGIYLLFGQSVLTFSQGKAIFFTGVGQLGLSKKFRYGPDSSIYHETEFGIGDTHQTFITIENPDYTIQFGKWLPEPVQVYLVQELTAAQNEL